PSHPSLSPPGGEGRVRASGAGATRPTWWRWPSARWRAWIEDAPRGRTGRGGRRDLVHHLLNGKGRPSRGEAIDRLQGPPTPDATFFKPCNPTPLRATYFPIR